MSTITHVIVARKLNQTTTKPARVKIESKLTGEKVTISYWMYDDCNGVSEIAERWLEEQGHEILFLGDSGNGFDHYIGVSMRMRNLVPSDFDRLVEAGAKLETKEDIFGDTKSGWWQDTVFLADNTEDAWKELSQE